MKVYCQSCGCHFPEDFEETKHPLCVFWVIRGFPRNFIEKHEDWAKKIWEYIFSFDHDAFGNETGFMLSAPDISIVGEYKGNQFEGKDESSKQTFMEDYENWPDEKRRRFQKSWLRIYYNRRLMDDLINGLYQGVGRRFRENDNHMEMINNIIGEVPLKPWQK